MFGTALGEGPACSKAARSLRPARVPPGFPSVSAWADCSAHLTLFTTNTSPDGSLPEISSQLGRKTKQNLFLV